MRVLHILNSYLPKTQQWIFQILKNSDCEVHIAANRLVNPSFIDDEFSVIENTSSRLLSRLKLKLIKVLFKKHLNRAKNKEFISRDHKFIKTLLKQYIIENNIDIIHVHFGNVAFNFLPLKDIFIDIPYVASFYGMDYEYLPHNNPEYNFYYEELFHKVDKIFCEGNNGKKILINKGVSESRIEVVPLGIKIANYNTDRFKDINSLKLIQIARYVEKKGHIYTIKAFNKALKMCPNMTLTLVGDFNGLYAECKSLVTSLGINDKVEFVDFIDYSTLHDYLLNYDVFIHPSIHTSDMDCEGGAPIVMLDAQLTGMPVISTFHCDIPTEVIHNSTGLLSEEKDIEGISNSIVEFYQMNNKDYLKFSLEAINHVKMHYNSVVNSKKYDSIYHELLS